MTPQLCKPYKQSINVQNWLAEPKLDGNRGIVIIENGVAISISRHNKPMYNTENIKTHLLQSGLNDVVLDGEFCISSTTDSWSQTTSILRTQTKHSNIDNLNFWVFDILPLQDWKNHSCQHNLAKRKNNLLSLIDIPFITIVKAEIVSDSPLDLLKKFTNLGFEGVVFKKPTSLYTYKRSSDWLKLKAITTAEYPIVNVLRGKGKYSKTTGSILISVNGVIVGVGTGMTDDDRNLIWSERDELVGTYLEVSYQTKSKDGSLIFPVFQRIRYDLT